MCNVNTVQGELPCDELGLTLTHEHIFVTNPEHMENYPSLGWDEDEALRRARDGLAKLDELGVGTVVDMTVPGLGRTIPRVQQVAVAGATNIIVATGIYAKSDLPSYFKMREPTGFLRMPDPLAELFIAEIEEGIAGTGVKAGVIKVVTDQEGLTHDVRRLLVAAAQAQRATAAPIFTHTDATHRTGLLQQQVLGEAGADLSKVLIGHCDAGDLDYLHALIEAGVTIGLDQFGSTIATDDQARVEKVVALCREGYADRVVLSHDAHFFSVNIDPQERDRRWPHWNPAHIVDHVLPELARRGVSQADLDQMLIHNPRRLFHRCN